MKTYIKVIEGRQVIKPASKIVIIKDDMQTINPTHEMIIEDGWEEYILENVDDPKDRTLKEMKAEMVETILAYDSSDAVNGFYVDGQFMWLDKVTRVGLMLRINMELENGLTETTLWFNGVPFHLELDRARKMLGQIELYASKCYDNTQRHIANVSALESKEEIESYNYRTGYPDKLKF